MNSFLLSLAALLVLALSAAFIGPHFVDWNSYRDMFEAHASRMLGRAVEIEGNVQLTMLPTPVLRFEKVRLADEQGSFEKPLAEVRSFTVWLAVPPLLRGAIEARQIDLDQPVINAGIKDDGSGTWSGLGRADAGLPIMPSSVALESVQIANGTLAIDGAGAAPVVLEALNGELSARSLDGPYKFAGTFTLANKGWELRFATGRREADGGTRLKGVLRDAEWQQSYAVDGALAGFVSVPKFKGHLLARFAPEGGRLADEAKQGAEAGHDAALEVKSDVDAGLVRATLDNIEATLRRNDQPHTVNGRLQADWRSGLAMQADLAARWFDLDALVGADKPQPPAGALAALARKLLERAAPLREGQLRVAIEQAVLAGDIVKGLKLDVARDADGLRIVRLAGETPGENSIALAGTLALRDKQAFAGHIAIQGKRLSRLLRWSGAQITAPAGTETGDYSFDAEVSIDPDSLALEQVKGDVLGTAFSGGLRYRSGARPKFELTFDSARLDIERLLGSEATLGSLRSLFLSSGGAEPSSRAGANPPAAPWLERVDAKIDLDIGAVLLPKLGETSLQAQLQLIGGNLHVEKAHLATKTSLQVHAEGQLDSVARQPDGLLTLNIKSADAAGLEGLAKFLELPEPLTPPARLQALSPLNLAVKLESKRGSGGVLVATIGGSVGSSLAGATVTFNGDLAEFAAGTVDAAATLSNADGKTLLAQLFPRLGAGALQQFSAGKGVLGLKAKGVPARGLDAHALIEAAGLRWSFDGEAKLVEAALDLSGSASFKAKTVAGALAMIGVRPGEGPDAAAGLDVTARLAKAGQAYDVTGLKGQIGGQQVQGKLRLELKGPKPKLDAIWAVSEASLPVMLGPVIDWSGAAGIDAALAQAIAGGSDFWPDKRFDAAFLNAFDGQVVLTAQKLRLAGELIVTDATVEAELAGGTLSLQTIKGGLFGGAFEASAQLTNRGSGVGFTGKAAAKGMRLEAVTTGKGAQALARGTADLNLTLVGEGLTPRGLAAGLTGDGRLMLGKGSIHGLSPAALSAFADTRQGGAQPSEAELVKRVTARFEGSDFIFAPLAVPFSVRNGTVRFDRVALVGGGGAATVASYLELASLKLDSEWVLASNRVDASEAAPEVTVVFSGPLSEFGRMAPDIDAQALEHYITMRRLEQDVERLEDLDLTGRRPRGSVPPLPERRLPATRESARPAPVKPLARRTPSAPGAAAPAQAPEPAISAPPPVERPAPSSTPVAPTPPAQAGTAPSLPIRSRPLRTEPSPSAAPSPPAASERSEVTAVPLPPLPSHTPPASERSALAPANQPSQTPALPPGTQPPTTGAPATTNALPQPGGEVLPWRTQTLPEPAATADGGEPLPDGAQTAGPATEPLAVSPRTPRPARPQPVPSWQAEVFGQPSN